jgi:cytosine/adenosine deaminase-related metal-dependent hydrolase
VTKRKSIAADGRLWSLAGTPRLFAGEPETTFFAEEVSAPDQDEIGFNEFVTAITGVVACSCCGSATGGAAAAATPQPSRLRNPLLWATHPAVREPPLKVRATRFVLPDVTVCSPDVADREHVDVLVDAGKIVAVAPTGQATLAGAELIEDCRGKWVSPSLVDMHSHMPIWNGLRLTRLFLLQTLRHGIGRIRDAGDLDGTSTAAALGLVRSGVLPGPEIHYAYAFVTGPGASPWQNSLKIADPADAQAAVSRLAAIGATWVKSYERLTPPLIAELCKAAEQQGLGVMGHVPTKCTLEDAAIPDGQHYFGVALPNQLRRDHIFERHVAWDRVDRSRMDEVVKAALEKRLVQTPTLHVTEQILQLERYQQARLEPKYRKPLPSFYADIIWHPVHGLPVYRGLGPADFSRVRRAIDGKRELTRRLHAAGASLRIGTDTQQPFVMPGAALLAEMRCFADAGVPAREVWRMATREAASALRIADAGIVEEKARADLLVTRSDPRDRIESDSIVAVVPGGRLVMAKDLDVAITHELERFEKTLTRHVHRWLVRFAVSTIARDFDQYVRRSNVVTIDG